MLCESQNKDDATKMAEWGISLVKKHLKITNFFLISIFPIYFLLNYFFSLFFCPGRQIKAVKLCTVGTQGEFIVR
jgi:hypothetical protein